MFQKHLKDILMADRNPKHTVFIYGTLKDLEIRRKVFGHDVAHGGHDEVIGHGVESWTTPEGKGFHTLVHNDRSIVPGDVFFMDDGDLHRLDKYEDEYSRVVVELKKNGPAWAYVLKRRYEQKKER